LNKSQNEAVLTEEKINESVEEDYNYVVIPFASRNSKNPGGV
jgi:hypothetical protein